jgi:hypothetical protein
VFTEEEEKALRMYSLTIHSPNTLLLLLLLLHYAYVGMPAYFMFAIDVVLNDMTMVAGDVFGFTAAELETVLDGSSYIFEQAAYSNVNAKQLQANLEVAGIETPQVSWLVPSDILFCIRL